MHKLFFVYWETYFTFFLFYSCRRAYGEIWTNKPYVLSMVCYIFSVGLFDLPKNNGLDNIKSA